MRGTAGAQLALRPALDEVRELAAGHNLIPVRHTFIDDCETPVSAYLKLRGTGPSFLLESAEQGQRFGRYSFIGFNPRAQLTLAGGKLVEEAPAAWPSAGPPGNQPLGAERHGTAPREIEFDDPYRAVADYVGRYKLAPLEGLPPFVGGAVGFFGYDLVRYIEPLGEPNPDELGLPDMALLITDALLVFDHLRHELTIIANVFCDEGGDVETGYAQAVATIEAVRRTLAGPVPGDGDGVGPRNVESFTSNVGRERFEEMVARIIEYIYAGDAFQVVPSQRWSAPAPVEAFSIYRGLRTINPSPYMYFFDFGDYAIAGASPEPLLKVSGRRAEIRPIAGTYPRGATTEEDLQRGQELLGDEKERAEHVMLVDLGRNDLGRVCEYGSVKVDELMVIETYSHVLHIVSSVTGRLRADVSAMDALRAVLPAGTLSGAPKVRAMQIIDELEPVKRGPYGGAVGYLSYSGDLDTAIHIRTVVVKDGMAHVQTGGGTVADAKPDYEYRESRIKAEAVFKAVELAASQPNWP